MNEFGIVHLVALAGWLAMVIAGYRSFRVGGRKTVTMILIWASIFLGAALLFSALG